MTSEQEAASQKFCDDIIDDMKDRWLAGRIRDATARGGFASVAATIAEDRYSAGSTAARVATYILLKHGMEAARDFIADLEHHEG